MPEDIYSSLWSAVIGVVQSGALCWNAEIGIELESIPGRLGDCLKDCKEACYDVDRDGWPVHEYLAHVEKMRVSYKGYISEYNGNRKSTVGLNDVSIVAFAKTIGLPLISMESPNRGQRSSTKIRIPDLCELEGVPHLDFNGFLRKEGIKL